jgi:hypothetical protein
VHEKSVDACLDDRATILGERGQKVREPLQLGRLLSSHCSALRFGLDLSVVAERQHEVPLGLFSVIGEQPVALRHGLPHLFTTTSPFFENREVLDPLSARAQDGLTDVAEARGLGVLPGLVPTKDLDNRLVDSVDGQFESGASRVLRHATGTFHLFGLCHDFLH